MKSCVIFCILILILFNCSQAFAVDNPVDKNVFPGMTVSEFSMAYPQFEAVPINGQCSIVEPLYGLDGKWTFNFEDGKLSWYIYDYYIQDYDQLNEANFDKCLQAAEMMISDLTKLYGEPVKINEGTKSFRDPAEDHHWGYEVIKAEWKKDEQTISAGFDFFGSKGEYFFVVQMLVD